MSWIKDHKFLLIGFAFDLADWGLFEVFGLPAIGDVLGDLPPAVLISFASKSPGFKKFLGLLEFIPILDVLPLWTISGYFADKGAKQ